MTHIENLRNLIQQLSIDNDIKTEILMYINEMEMSMKSESSRIKYVTENVSNDLSSFTNYIKSLHEEVSDKLNKLLH